MQNYSAVDRLHKITKRVATYLLQALRSILEQQLCASLHSPCLTILERLLVNLLHFRQLTQHLRLPVSSASSVYSVHQLQLLLLCIKASTTSTVVIAEVVIAARMHVLDFGKCVGSSLHFTAGR